MNPNTRACIAFVAGKVIGSSGGSHVYDYAQSRHLNVGGNVSQQNVNLYDYERSCHFTGKLPQLYDHGTGFHVTLEIVGRVFKGYAYDSGTHFSGQVNGSSISIYDFGAGQHFNYSL